MGSTCSCFKSIKEPINIRIKHNPHSSSNNLKAIYPANYPTPSMKNSDIHTKENLAFDDDGNITENNSNVILKNKQIPAYEKKKSEDFIMHKHKEPKTTQDSLQIYNNFTEPMVKLLKICRTNKQDEEKHSQYDDSFELDENGKMPITMKYEEVAP